MRRTIVALLAVCTLAVLGADAQVNFSNVPANTVVGRLGIGSGPTQAIPLATLGANLTGVGANAAYTNSATGAVARTIQAKLDDILAAADFGVKCDGATNDTNAINAALVRANGKVLVFPPGSCLVTPGSIIIGAGVANVPAQVLGYSTLIFANTVVASPLITVDTPETSLGSAVFTFAGFRFSCTGNGAGKGAYALKIHGSQFATYRDLEMVGGCTAGGLWLSGEPNAGIYNNLFEHIVVNGMTGPGIIAKSINNSSQYYISANAWTGITSIFNTTYGADLDYASIAISGGDLESNTTAGLNIDHAIQVDLYGVHFESNNAGATAITTTANTNGLRVHGGRTIGSITTSAKTNPANFFQTSDTSALPVISNTGLMSFVASVNFNSGNTDTSIPITLPIGFTRYRVVFVSISGASQTLTTATGGLFTAAAGAGVAIVTAATAITVATASDATNNNMQQMAINNATTESYTAATLFWRVATAQGAAATGTVAITIQPVS